MSVFDNLKYMYGSLKNILQQTIKSDKLYEYFLRKKFMLKISIPFFCQL